MYIHLYTQPARVELVPGHGVYLTQRQLDEALDSSSPTKLIRNLTRVFFTREILASSSVLGNRGNPDLDQDIVSACIRELDNNAALSCVNKFVFLNRVCSAKVQSDFQDGTGRRHE